MKEKDSQVKYVWNRKDTAHVCIGWQKRQQQWRMLRYIKRLTGGWQQEGGEA